MASVLFLLVGIIVGGIVAWLVSLNKSSNQFQSRLDEAERRANKAEGKAAALEGTISELRSESLNASEDFEKLRSKMNEEHGERIKAETQLRETNQRLKEEKELLEEAKNKLTDTFKALAGDTLDKSTTSFLKLAKETFDKALIEASGDLGKRQEAIQGLVAPISESLKQFEEHVRSIEKNRQEAYTGVTEQLKFLSTTQQQLQKETANLVTALRKPQVRGRWGEMTLRRVVEMVGMSEHCDFSEQVTSYSEEGKKRPDLIVHLPASREIVVDAKISLEAYLDAVSADSEEKRKDAMTRHAAQVRVHMNTLADKRYWEQFAQAPDYVVMFIPGESFFAAAVDTDQQLIEDGLRKRVILAAPTTFIALLQAIAYGWRQEQITKNAQDISELGKQLYERMRILADHISDIGKGLEKANEAYNNAVGSIESRVLPAARRFKDLGATTSSDVDILSPVEITPRALTAPEILEKEK
jgi:DNA recombination protein RmuC